MSSIPVNKFIPYSFQDLSVVIPQASQYVRRMEWFLPQYIKMTPIEVLKNTVVVYDPEDTATQNILSKYGIKGITTTPPHSTYKMEAGFNEVKTRLCVRMHNDAMIKRSDWASAIINRFNNDDSAQLVGVLHPSGVISEEAVYKLMSWYPSFDTIYNLLTFSGGERSVIGSSFYSAFFIAAQTYIFKALYPLVVEFTQGKMDKEDVILTLLSYIHNVKLVSWSNMFQFINADASYGDFDEGVVPQVDQQIITEENSGNYDVPVFEEVVYE